MRMSRFRTWALRRAMGRMRIDDDIVRHLSTFQRLGETFEVESPGELLPVGARTVFRALRTRAAAQIGPDWVWPYWLQNQLDPTSPAFTARGHLPFLTNMTARNWTLVGNVASPWEAIVDPRGLVTTWFDGWSLDWWIGAEDGWHVPSREPASRVRQRLIGAAPVVETSIRVPGGHAVHRAYACFSGAASTDEAEIVVVEVENRSPVPVAVALAVRPYNPEGLAVIERIGLHDGTTVTVDGRIAMLLPRPPAQVAASTFHEGDCAQVVLADGASARTIPSGLRDEAGMAQAAFVYPLPHTATLRVALPMVPASRTRRRGQTRRRVEQAPTFPAAIPSAEQVARGWAAQSRGGMRLDLPDARLQEAVDANRRFLLALHDGPDITPGPSTYHRFWFRDAAFLLAALGRYGYSSQVAEVLRSYPARQRVDGFFFSQAREWDSNGCALWSIAEHWRLSRDGELVEPMISSIAKGAQWIDRKRRTGRSSGPELRGLLPAGVSAEHLGPFDYFYWDDFWCTAGLRSAADVLAAFDQRQAAELAHRHADALWSDIVASLGVASRRLGSDVIPAGPRRRIDAGVIGSLVACEPLHLLPATDRRIAATLDVVRERFSLGDAFFQAISHTGLGTYLTMQVAEVELANGDRRALDRLQWLLRVATPTWTWPEAIHPQLPGGCMGDGHHGWAAAEFLSFVRNLLLREVAPSRIEPSATATVALCTLFPDEWLGQGLEVHDAPTHFGTVSYAVRWHGARPALLWEVQPHPGIDAVRLTAPGLDLAWSTTQRAGEVLLAVPERGALSG
jgi:hypothetical protein